MSAKSERIDSVSDANALRLEVGNDLMSETLADPLTGQTHELVTKRDGGDEEGNDSLGSADLEKQTKSVNGELDLGLGTENLGGESSEIEKKVLVHSKEVLMVKGEKNSDEMEKKVLAEKEMEPDMVCSHGADLGDVKGSDDRMDCEDLVEGDRKSDGSGKLETNIENLDVECFMGLEPYESKDENILDDDDKATVTDKVKISDSDLVWAKVRSHPWWPGQVFDVSAATDKAKKYFRKGSFLVTYFGDCTFAWNDASKIKPFRQHFSHMAKQSSLPDFIDAIDFALEEVSRRIEFGLACSCISEEVYKNIKTQNIINPGIREDSSTIHGGDKVSSAIFFEPAKLVEYVKRLACSPSNDATDELQLVTKRAQLLAFNRWNGYTELPEFETLEGSIESAPKISLAEDKNSVVKVSDPVPEKKVSDPVPEKSKQVYTKRRKTEDQDDYEPDGVFEYEDTTVPKKKEKTLAEFIAEKRLSRRNGNISQGNSGKIPHSEKKRKVVHSEIPKSTKKIKETENQGSSISPKSDRKNRLSASDKTTPEKGRKSFGIGASILKVANQMHCSTPTRLIPCSNSASKKAAESNGSGKSLQEKPKAKELSERENFSLTNKTVSTHHTASATKTPSGKSSSITKELEQDIKEAPSTNLVEDPVLESRDMKDSSKEIMVNEDAYIADEMAMKGSNLTEENNNGADLKEQPNNKNCSDGSESCKKDVFAE